MATININRSAAVVLSPLIDDSSKRQKTLNGPDYVVLSFIHDSFVEFFPGDYITWEGETYTIKQAPAFDKISEEHYKYDLRFEGPYHGLKEAVYLLDNEGEFFLTGTAEDFIDQMVVNLNRVHGSGAYNTGSVVSTEYKNLQFNNESCWDVLLRICDEFELEFSLTAGININLATTIGSSTGLSYEYTSGLKNIKREKVSDKNLITRLYAYGAEKNIDYNYGTKRLHLPSATYPNRYMESGVATYGIREVVKQFDDIYPSFTGTVDSSSANNVIIDAGIDFDLNSYLLEGMIVFKTGDLAGMQFEISEYNHTTHQVTFKTYTDEHGQEFPSATFNPAAGDQFTFVDINMPTSYITAAESALETAASAHLSAMSSPHVVYNLTMDQHALRGATTSLDAGDIITITDAELAIGGVSMRIIELTQSIADQYNYSIKLGDVILRGYLLRMQMAQADLQRQIYEQRITATRAARNAIAQSLEALTAAAAAQSTADGKIISFWQDTEPTAEESSEGDIWFDTGNGNTIYVYESGTWVNRQDSDIAAAISSAQTAQTTADGKAIVYLQDNAPTSGMSEGDIWIDTNDSNKQYVYSGTAWVESTTGDALQALADAAAAQSTADGKIVTFYQASEPTTGMSEGDIWFDEDDGNKIYVYESGVWVNRQDSEIAQAINAAQTAQTTADGKAIVFIQSAAPVTGMDVGDIWVDSNDNYTTYVYSGSQWVEMTVADAAQAMADAAAAVAAVDGKVAAYWQPTPPTGDIDVGDLWFDDDDGNHMYTYRAALWEEDAHTVFRQSSAPTSGMIEGDFWIDTDAGNSVDIYEVSWPASSRTVFAQDTEPTSGMSNNDFWIDTDGDNTVYIYNGSAWVLHTGTTHIQAEEPTDGGPGDYWFDSDDSYTAYYVSGSWVNFTGTRWIQTSEPSSGMSAGDLWFDSDDSYKPYVYHEDEWVDNRDQALGLVIAEVADAQASADGKVTTFFAPSTEPPTAEGLGDLWYQEDTGILVRWNGSDWTDGVSDHTETVIGNGLVTTGRLVVMNATTEQGGICGTTGAGTSEIGLWLGSTYANRASAPFRVTHGGAVTMTNASLRTASTNDYIDVSAQSLSLYDNASRRVYIHHDDSKDGTGELQVQDLYGKYVAINVNGIGVNESPAAGFINTAILHFNSIGSIITVGNAWDFYIDDGDLDVTGRGTFSERVRVNTSNNTYGLEIGGSGRFTGQVYVGDVTTFSNTAIDHGIIVGASGSGEQAGVEIHGNRSGSDNTVGTVGFHNLSKGATDKRIVQLVGRRYGDDDAGQLRIQVSNTAGAIQTIYEGHSSQHTFYIAGTAELVINSSYLRPYTNRGLDLGGPSYYFDDAYIHTLHVSSFAPDDIFMGDYSSFYHPSIDHGIGIYAAGTGEMGAIEIAGNQTTNAAVGMITFHNVQSSHTYDYIARIQAQRYNDNDAGKFLLEVSNSSASLQTAYTVVSASHSWYVNGTAELYLNSSELRPITNNGLDLGDPSFRFSGGYVTTLYATNVGSSSSYCSSGYFSSLYLGLTGAVNQSYKLMYNASSNQVTYYTDSSDRRLKRNLTPIKNGLEVVLQATPYTFQYRKKAQGITGEDPNEIHAGMVTQDFETIAPELVRRIQGTRYNKFNYEEYTAYLTHAIQELHNLHVTEIKQLKEQIELLKAS